MSESTPEVTPVAPTEPVSTPDVAGTPVATVVNDLDTAEKDVQTVEADASGVEAAVKSDVEADAPEVEADVEQDKKNWSLAKGVVRGLGLQAEEAERILIQLWNSGLKVVKHDAPAKSASDVFPTAVPPVS
jgi:hypothetical protein